MDVSDVLVAHSPEGKATNNAHGGQIAGRIQLQS